jgi:RNA polymerase sigma-70 factor (ECF subfamily)
LPHNYRLIISLRYFEDLKLEEIADILGENLNTVKTRLYAGLKKLRIELEG